MGRQVTELRRSIQKDRTKEASFATQRSNGLIDEEMQRQLVVPIINHRLRLEQELELLQQQRNLSDNVDQVEDVVSRALSAYRKGLHELDTEARNRLLRLLGIRLTGLGRRVLVTGVIDPSLFTTGQTWASPRERSRRCRWA